jgi:hypothetical protein
MLKLHKPSIPVLAIGVTALALAASGAAMAQSSPGSDAASASDKSVSAQKQAQPQPQQQSSALTTAYLSNSVGFDASAGYRSAEVIPSAVPTFRYHTGWTSVTRIGTGHYCLNGASYGYSGVVSISSRDTVGIGYVEYDSYGFGCPGVGVWTYRLA